MYSNRLERAEALRRQALDSAPAAAQLADTAGADAGTMQSAWCSFVPLLAHPVMAGPAGRAMEALDAAAALVTTRRSAAA